jgi:hypothetical protein
MAYTYKCVLCEKGEGVVLGVASSMVNKSLTEFFGMRFT